MARKRKVNYPVARTSRRPGAPGAGPEVERVRPNMATVNPQARLGAGAFVVGSRVLILGTGLYSGEAATVEALPGGVIPAALVRTDGGQTRRVRTIDLEPLPDET